MTSYFVGAIILAVCIAINLYFSAWNSGDYSANWSVVNFLSVTYFLTHATI
jgi:hypothetical protein